LSCEGNWVYGKEDGLCRQWSIQGILVKEEVYEDGELKQ